MMFFLYLISISIIFFINLIIICIFGLSLLLCVFFSILLVHAFPHNLTSIVPYFPLIGPTIAVLVGNAIAIYLFRYQESIKAKNEKKRRLKNLLRGLIVELNFIQQKLNYANNAYAITKSRISNPNFSSLRDPLNTHYQSDLNEVLYFISMVKTHYDIGKFKFYSTIGSEFAYLDDDHLLEDIMKIFLEIDLLHNQFNNFESNPSQNIRALSLIMREFGNMNRRVITSIHNIRIRIEDNLLEVSNS